MAVVKGTKAGLEEAIKKMTVKHNAWFCLVPNDFRVSSLLDYLQPSGWTQRDIDRALGEAKFYNHKTVIAGE